MYPSGRMTSPDPVPLPAEPLAVIVTTEGTTWPATEVTGQALAVDGAAEGPALTAEPDARVKPTTRAPATPAATNAGPSATHSHRRGLRAGLDSLTQPPYPGRWTSSGPDGKDAPVVRLSHKVAVR